VAYGVPVLIVTVGWLVRRELARRADGARPAPSYRLVTRELNLERTGPSGP
jgi:hypothetical protein